jgi:hypothetical protein
MGRRHHIFERSIACDAERGRVAAGRPMRKDVETTTKDGIDIAPRRKPRATGGAEAEA